MAPRTRFWAAVAHSPIRRTGRQQQSLEQGGLAPPVGPTRPGPHAACIRVGMPLPPIVVWVKPSRGEGRFATNVAPRRPRLGQPIDWPAADDSDQIAQRHLQITRLTVAQDLECHHRTGRAVLQAPAKIIDGDGFGALAVDGDDLVANLESRPSAGPVGVTSTTLNPSPATLNHIPTRS